ncbi:MAG: diguanylate cyclase, partial [Planctomycetes bacterium]|nr:diguanylate cyclase [Planctomycetota bacterium]
AYCATGLHNELRLSADESRPFWEASLCKAVAAKVFVQALDQKLADEAFIAGLFHDFSLPILFAVAREEYMKVLQRTDLDTGQQLMKERELFRMDHTEVGRMLAQKMELPDLFVDAVAFHHNYDKLEEFIEQKPIAQGIYVASLFPHLTSAWHSHDPDTPRAFLQEHAPSTDIDSYLATVQKELNALYAFFHDGALPETQLIELLERTTREIADNTTELVGTVNELLRQAASTGMEMNELIKNQGQLEDKSVRDPLTGVLNRDGFRVYAEEQLAKAARYGTGFAIAYFDIDKFKDVNDTFGHDVGDSTLTTVVSKITEVLPEHCELGRLGGDEFILLLHDCNESDARRLVDRIVSTVGAANIQNHGKTASLSLSAGMLYVSHSDTRYEFDELVCACDELMYIAKRAGGNRAEIKIDGA